MTAGKVHHEAHGDRLAVDAGGVITIKRGARLIVKPGAEWTVPVRVKELGGTSIGISPTDLGAYLILTSDSPITITVQPDVDIVDGATWTFEQAGPGQVTFVEGLAVTIRTPETLKLAGRYAVATLIKKSANVFTLTGYLERAA